MKLITTESAPAAIGPYAQAIEANGFVFTSGQLPLVPETMKFPSDHAGEQTAQCLKNVAAILASLNLTLHDVVKTTVYLADLNDFASVNEVYAAMFGDHKPARSCFEVAGLPLGAKVEIEVVAVNKNS